MYQIYIGIEHGLSLQQLKLYAKKEFDKTLMFIIRNCLENGYIVDEFDFDKLNIENLKDNYTKLLNEDNFDEENINVKNLPWGKFYLDLTSLYTLYDGV